MGFSLLKSIATFVACLLLSLPGALSNPEAPNLQLPFRSTNKARFNASKFDKQITDFATARSLPALSVAVTYDDRLVYASAFGYANVSAGEVLNTTHRFRLASVSKSVTAIAIMRLVESGYLEVTDTVFGPDGILGHRFGHLPYSPFDEQITVQHLLEHTSGYVDQEMCGEGCDPTYLPELLGLDQWGLIAALMDRYNGTRQPGTYASYSNFGYFILGRIVEAASKKSLYQDYVQDFVLKPAGIEDMRIAMDKRRKTEVVYYDITNSTTPYGFHVERRDSVGAWIATPIDLVKLTTLVDGLSGRADLLNKSTLSIMFEPSPAKDKERETTYAKGFTVKLDTDGHVSQVAKEGGYPGTNSWIEIDFQTKTSFAIVTNTLAPKNESLGFNGSLDMKDLMDKLISEVDEWPAWDLFER